MRVCMVADERGSRWGWLDTISPTILQNVAFFVLVFLEGICFHKRNPIHAIAMSKGSGTLGMRRVVT